VLRNPIIRSLSNLGSAFTTGVWSFTNQHETNNFYRPVQTVLYISAYAIGHFSTVAYHAQSILLHVATTILIYFIAVEMLNPSAALLAAALFGVHPVHTESVAWIAGIADVSCGFFFAMSIWMYQQFERRKQRVWLWVSAAAFFLALLSKEMAVTLPLV